MWRFLQVTIGIALVINIILLVTYLYQWYLYRRVMVECFPSMHQSKIRCLELFCIHLGLATSSCVLEHSKRLATNIHDEFVGGGNPTADLL